MEKVLEVVKGLFAGFMDLLTHPVSKVTEKVQKEDLVKASIKGVILAFMYSLINVLARVRSLRIIYTKNSSFDNAVESLRPIATLFKTFAFNVLGIIVVAVVLFIIFKLVKDEKPIAYTISMVVNSVIAYTVILLIALIFALIPGVFGTTVASLLVAFGKAHACLTLIVSFMSSLTSVNTDKLILVSIAVFAIVGIVSAIINLISSEESLADFTKSKYVSSPGYYAVKSNKKSSSSSYSEEDIEELITDTLIDSLS